MKFHFRKYKLMCKAILILFLFLGSTTYAQKELTFSENGLSQKESLFITIKIWGFLKYYHPNVAKGKFNWDQQLLEVLPKIEKAKTKEDLSKRLEDWIDALGKIKICDDCTKKSGQDYFDQNFNLSWIQDTANISIGLSKKLKFIRDNRFHGKQYYVSVDRRVGNIEIINEKEYKDFDWKDENLRILALARYWNILEYFFPYKYQMNEDWNSVLMQTIPKFLLSPKSEKEYHLTMLELVVKVNDSHANLFTKQTLDFFGLKYIPANFTIIGNKAVITGIYNDSLAKINDIQKGDIVVKINGKSIPTLVKEKYKYVSGSNPPGKLKNYYYVLFNGSTDSVEIEFSRDTKTITKKIARYPFIDFKYSKPKTASWKLIDNNIGYIDMGVLETSEVPEMMEKLKGTKAIIFDIRNYPKETLYSIAYYLTSEKRVFYKKIIPDLQFPGKFLWEEGQACGKDGELEYKGKIILIVNERTQSHAEFTTMCLQQGDNVTTIGSTTSGTDGNGSGFSFVGGFKTGISGIGIFYPDRTETQRVGLRIDIEVKPTLEGLKSGRDEILEKAIHLAQK